MTIAIIGGTGIDEAPEFASGRGVKVVTRFGKVDILESSIGTHKVFFLPRHGLDHSTPPALINYRSQIAALKQLKVDRVIGVCAVGSLTRSLQCGSFALLGDFIDFTKHRVDTFFGEPDGPLVHTDFTHPYCADISRALAESCGAADVSFATDAVYVGVDGPRYESPAEIRLYASWGGHVIGMTNLPEAVLAREAGLCYGAIAVVTNLAAGLSPVPLSHDEVRMAMQDAGANLRSILISAVSRIPEDCSCNCATNDLLIL